jgi:hypothetical protein
MEFRRLYTMWYNRLIGLLKPMGIYHWFTKTLANIPVCTFTWLSSYCVPLNETFWVVFKWSCIQGGMNLFTSKSTFHNKVGKWEIKIKWIITNCRERLHVETSCDLINGSCFVPGECGLYVHAHTLRPSGLYVHAHTLRPNLRALLLGCILYRNKIRTLPI